MIIKRKKVVFLIKLKFLKYLINKNDKYRFSAETSYRLAMITNRVHLSSSLEKLLREWLEENIYERVTDEGKKFTLYLPGHKTNYFISSYGKEGDCKVHVIE